jgi:HTH-type transcriptional regulator, competence development regulator
MVTPYFDGMGDKAQEKLGDILRRRRISLGFSLRDVSKKTDISNPYPNQIEQHKISSPSPSVLKKLSDLYSVSYSRLLELAGHPSFDKSEKPVFFRTSSGLEELTKNEEKQLLDYLEFIRSRRKSV